MRAHLIETSALEELLLDVHRGYRIAMESADDRDLTEETRYRAHERCKAYMRVAWAIEHKIRGEVRA